MNVATNHRRERGIALAKTKGARIRHIVASKYLVPSAQDTGAAGYVVDVEAQSCTCPDYEARRSPCKHTYAAAYFRQEVTAPDGSTVVTEAIIIAKKKPTYAQNWPAYNRARADEPVRVPLLLHSLCQRLVEPPRRPGPGRPRLPLRDAVFCAAMKVFLEKTQRDLAPYLKNAVERGLIQSVPGYASQSRTMEDETLTPVLERLVELSALPLRGIETCFAADGTGFGTSTFSRWFDEKHGHGSQSRVWVRLHAMVGTRMNVYTAVRMTENAGDGINDSPNFAHLVERTHANGWNMQEVSADKGYLSKDNYELVERVRAQPFIAFKTDSRANGHPAWDRAYHLFCANTEGFLARYHKRSNVEATFHATKERFGGQVKSRVLSAQFNEVLLKCLCFNLCRLVLAFHEMGIEPQIGPAPTPLLVEVSAAE